MAHHGGIDVLTDDGTVAILTERSVAVAVPDLAGGVSFQEQSESRVVHIESIRGPGQSPQMLEAGPDTTALTLLQGALVEGRAQVLYRRAVGSGVDQVDHLVLHDRTRVLRSSTAALPGESGRTTTRGGRQPRSGRGSGT